MTPFPPPESSNPRPLDLRVLPPDLRGRVIAASLAARAAGRYTPAGPDITPLEAFGRAAEAFDGVLADLSEDEWHRPALRDLDVQGLVGHLVGVELDVQRSLRQDPDVAEVNHVESTQQSAVRQQGEEPARTHREWREAVAASRTAFGAADEAEDVAVHTMRLPAPALLVVRAFELWAHENDIRRATQRTPSVPDDSTLALMTDLASRSLPTGAARIGMDEPVSLRLVLTGPGGGTWQVRLGPDGGEPAEVGVVTDAVGFCRLVANRVDASSLDVDTSGDASRVGDVLAAAAALALD